MIGYVMVGTNDLSAATSFYDIVLETIGLVRVETQDDLIAYAENNHTDQIEFYVCKPFNRKIATNGNGTMISFQVKNRGTVDSFHKVGLDQGAKNEGFPGPRPSDGHPYYSYLRDLDGNKICVYCS